jgi:pimeloyl-ACP methyl ester carboxylesterase
MSDIGASSLPTSPLPTLPPLPIVLVHGAWHGAWCWAATQAALDRQGIASYAVDLPGHGTSDQPLGDLHGDAAHVAAVIERLGTDVVLVGHSYGGAVITEAAGRTVRVRHLVYLTAFVPDVGESVLSLNGSLPPVATALSGAMRPGAVEGETMIDPELAVAAFYARCDPEVQRAAVARLGAHPTATLVQPTTAAPWRQLPSTYVRCTDDQAISLAHQDHMAARCGEVLTLDADHSPFASVPDQTADLLARLARRAGA